MEALPVWVNVALLAGAAAAIWAAGARLTTHVDALADRSGARKTLLGALLVGGITSLPEVSTTVSALRLGRPSLAFSNVLGTNIFNHVLLLPADAFGTRPLFATVDRSAAAATLAIVLLGIYLVRLTGAPRSVAGRKGIESVLVLLVCAAGTALIFGMG